MTNPCFNIYTDTSLLISGNSDLLVNARNNAAIHIYLIRFPFSLTVIMTAIHLFDFLNPEMFHQN